MQTHDIKVCLLALQMLWRGNRWFYGSLSIVFISCHKNSLLMSLASKNWWRADDTIVLSRSLSCERILTLMKDDQEPSIVVESQDDDDWIAVIDSMAGNATRAWSPTVISGCLDLSSVVDKRKIDFSVIHFERMFVVDDLEVSTLTIDLKWSPLFIWKRSKRENDFLSFFSFFFCLHSQPTPHLPLGGPNGSAMAPFGVSLLIRIDGAPFCRGKYYFYSPDLARHTHSSSTRRRREREK